jgi:hypothetical protein
LIGRGKISPLGHFKNQISTIVTRQSMGTWLKPLLGTVQKSAVPGGMRVSLISVRAGGSSLRRPLRELMGR